MPSEKSDVYALQPLHSLGHWLGILPKIRRNDEWLIEPRWFRLYPIVVTMIYTSMYVLITYGRVVYISNLLETTVYLLKLASDGCLMAATIGSIIGVNMVNGGKLLKFLQLMKSVDDDFKEIVAEETHSYRSLYIELYMLHIYCLIHYAYTTYFWSNSVGLVVFKYFCMRDLFVYHTFVLSHIVRHYALAIKYRYEKINRMMNRLRSNYDLAEGDFVSHDWNVKKITCVYSKLSDCVAIYNSIFGVHFITLYICIVVNLLAPMNIALIYGIGRRDFAGTTFGSGLIGLCMLWTTLPLILGSAIFLACDKCTKEAAKTPSLCYRLIQELPDDGKDLVLKEELRDFANQARIETAEFSAAGFFSINSSILFSLFGSVTAYLIVLIQFH